MTLLAKGFKVQVWAGPDINNASCITHMLIQSTGDFVFADFKTDLERIIDLGMATALVYGDAGESQFSNLFVFRTKKSVPDSKAHTPTPFLAVIESQRLSSVPHISTFIAIQNY